MKKALLFVCSCLFAAVAAAMPARPGTFTVTQSDGTVLTLRMVGDEHFHYFVDVNSGRKMQLAADGNYIALSDAVFQQRLSAAKERRASVDNKRLERMTRYQQSAGISMDPSQPAGPRKAVGTFNGSLSGQKKGLVILVNFSDLEHRLDDPQMAWDRAFNEVGYKENGHEGSVHDYFYDQSYGTFDLEFDVVGPVTVSKNMKYYGQNNSYGSDAHPAEMVAEACKLVNSQVNFKDYDWDGDGEVDQVYVIYAGYGESSGAPAETIWPHEYWLEYGYGSKLYLDGVYINTYACSCELRGNGRGLAVQNGIGTACHEFSHCVGYPDFYDVDYGGCFGMDEWDVMGSGGYNGPATACEVPAGFTAYERWMAGWLEPQEITEGCDIENIPCILDEPVAYILRSKAKGTIARPVDEYFIIENRQPVKWFLYPAQAHGLLVCHVDYNKTAWSQNAVNVQVNNQRMSIIPAGKNFGTYNSSAKSWYATSDEYRSMLFPGPKKITELTNESHYDYGGKLHNRNTDGTYNLNIPLTNITEKGGKISFQAKGGLDLGYRWVVNFEAGGGNCTVQTWKQENNGETIVLPTVEAPFEGLHFFGWSTQELGITKTRPADLMPAGTIYKPQADVTFYAIYGVCSDGPLFDEYKYTTTLKDGQDYVFATKNTASSAGVYAISVESLMMGTTTKTPQGTAIDVDFTTAVPFVLLPASDLIWRIHIEDEVITVKNGNSYLNVVSGGLTLSDTPCYLRWDNDYGLYNLANTGSRYYVHTTSGKFSVSSQKIKSSRVYLYEKSDFSDKDITYTSHPAEIVEGIADITLPASNTPVYDLQGRRATGVAHGIYLQGGRKVIR